MIENIHLTLLAGIFTNGMPLFPRAEILSAALDVNILGHNRIWTTIIVYIGSLACLVSLPSANVAICQTAERRASFSGPSW